MKSALAVALLVLAVTASPAAAQTCDSSLGIIFPGNENISAVVGTMIPVNLSLENTGSLAQTYTSLQFFPSCYNSTGTFPPTACPQEAGLLNPSEPAVVSGFVDLGQVPNSCAGTNVLADIVGVGYQIDLVFENSLTLQPGDDCTINFELFLQQPDSLDGTGSPPADGFVVLQSNLGTNGVDAGQCTGGGTSTDSNSGNILLSEFVADLEVAKECVPGFNPQTGLFDHTLTAENPFNPSGATLENCVVSDPLAPNCDGFTIPGQLHPGDTSAPISCSSSTLLNTATVTCNVLGLPPSVTVQATDSSQCVITDTAKFTIAKDCEVQSAQGNNDISITLTNTGNVALVCDVSDPLASYVQNGVALPVGTTPVVLNTSVSGLTQAQLNTVTATCTEQLTQTALPPQSANNLCEVPSFTIAKDCELQNAQGNNDISITMTNTGDVALVCDVSDPLASYVQNGVALPVGGTFCSAPDGENLTLSDDTVVGSELFEVCNTIATGPNYDVAGPNGHLTLRAGKTVAFGEGFSVGVDGRLTVEIDPALAVGTTPVVLNTSVSGLTQDQLNTVTAICTEQLTQTALPPKSANDLCEAGTCDVEIVKEVSCNGGPFADGIVCLAGETVTVRYVVNNTSTPGVDLFSCQVTESNPAIGDWGPIGNIPSGGSAGPFDDTDQICKDAEPGEPDTATVRCECAAPGSGVFVTDDDPSDFSCETCEVKVDKQISCSSGFQFVDVGFDDGVQESCVGWLGGGPCEPGNVRDEFNTVSYSNNDGSKNWAGDWIEDDVAGPGPNAGHVRIQWNRLVLNDYPDTGTQPSAARQVDLSGAQSATMSFKWTTHSGVDTSDHIVAEMSKDGGATWTTLKDFTGFSGARTDVPESFDISQFISSQTQVRFRVHRYYGATSENFKVEDLDIGWILWAAQRGRDSLPLGGDEYRNLAGGPVVLSSTLIRS